MSGQVAQCRQFIHRFTLQNNKSSLKSYHLKYLTVCLDIIKVWKSVSLVTNVNNFAYRLFILDKGLYCMHLKFLTCLGNTFLFSNSTCCTYLAPACLRQWKFCGSS